MTLSIGLLMHVKDDLKILSLAFKCQEVCKGLHRTALQQQRTNEAVSQGFTGRAFVLPLHLRFSKRRLHNKEQFWTLDLCFSWLQVVPDGTIAQHSFQVQSLLIQTAPKGLERPSLFESFLFVRFRLAPGRTALRMWVYRLCLDLWLLLPQLLGLPFRPLLEGPVLEQSYPNCLLVL